MTSEGATTLLKNNKSHRGGDQPLQPPEAWGSAQRSVLLKHSVANNCPRPWAAPSPCGEDWLYVWSKYRVQEATSTDFFFHLRLHIHQ